MTVRAGTEADAAAAAGLHASQIEDGFLSSLGAPFLTVLYRRVVRHPGSFLVVADEDGAVMGFAAGCEDVGRLYREFLLRDGLVAGVRAAPRLARAWRRVLETLRYPSGGNGSPGPLPAAELLSVAVAPAARGLGLGRLLVAEVTDELRRRGVAGVRVVVGSENDGAIGLYRACGFVPAGRIEVHRGAASEVLTWS